MTSTPSPSQIEVYLSFVDPSLENVDPDAFEYVDMVPKSTKSLVFNREPSVPPSIKDASSTADSFAKKKNDSKLFQLKPNQIQCWKSFKLGFSSF